MPHLEKIQQPEDLRRLAPEMLPDVADALRSELIEIGSEIGGHFAGSLGVVELSVGLHYVFDTPKDRVVWDVGHQAYAHKALTGRLQGLRKVKQREGPSGFLRRCESDYDVFGAGHAGTSVSAALGDHLGAIFFQLPPNLKKDLQLLSGFLSLIPKGFRAAMEFRHDSWFDEQVLTALREHDVALCAAETDEKAAPEMVSTASWGYVRLRRSEYDDGELASWARRIGSQGWGEAFVFFKHEDERPLAWETIRGFKDGIG